MLAVILILIATNGVTAYIALTPPLPSEIDIVEFQLAWLPYGGYTWAYVALDKGYAEDEGISLRLFRGYGTTPGATAVDQGQYVFGISSVNDVQILRDQGSDIKSIMLMQDRCPMAFGFWADLGITSPQDLEGHDWGQYPGSVDVLAFPAFCEVNNLDQSKIPHISVDIAAKVPGFFAGEYDMFGCNEESSYITALTQAADSFPDKELIKFSWADWGFDNLIGAQTIIAKDSFLEENPDLTRRFLRAMARGMEFCINNPEEATDIQLKYNPELDRDIHLAQMMGWIEQMTTAGQQANGIGWHSEAKVQHGYNIVRDVYDLSEMPLSDIYTNDYLPVIMP
jgi:NitT/TauT family transport system substrate-binding protein